MGIVFAVRGNSFNARYSTNGASPVACAGVSGHGPRIATSGFTGEIGGQSIDLSNNTGPQVDCLQYLGRNNIPAHAMSILVRCSFAQNSGLLGIFGFASGVSSAFNAVDIYFNSGTLNTRYKDAQVNDRCTIVASWTPTVNQIYDILLVWDGNNGTTATLYVDGVSIGTAVASQARPADDRQAINYITLGAMEFDVAATFITINEFVMWDVPINPASVQLTSGLGALNGNARAAFVDVIALDATSFVYPAAGDIRSTASGLINAGVAVVPTAVIPTLANTKTGVAGDGGTGTYDGSDRWSDPGVSEVLAPTAYKANSPTNNRVGTAAASTDPGVGSVKKNTKYNINGVDLVGTYDLTAVVTGATGAVDAAADGLKAYLELIEGLTVLTEWPEANKKLAYPSVTITTGLPKRTPIQPEEIAVTMPDINNQVVQTLAIGEYDIPIQLDLWCRTKAERRQFLNAILASFNVAELSSEKPCGLSLQLTDYFNVYARYEIDTHNFRDDEMASQTQERRATISLLVNTREIAQRTMYAIVSAAIVQQVDSSNGELTDDSQNTETNQIY